MSEPQPFPFYCDLGHNTFHLYNAAGGIVWLVLDPKYVVKETAAEHAATRPTDAAEEQTKRSETRRILTLELWAHTLFSRTSWVH